MKDICLPIVSFVIPVYNAELSIGNCLESIIKQDYPKEKYEILVIDDYSEDNTVAIANKYNIRLFFNGAKDCGNGKTIGIDNARGEIVVLLDADNEIVQKDWLRKMVFPLCDDPSIFGVESIYPPRKEDIPLNRYLNLLHFTDPLAWALSAKIDTLPKKNLNDYILYELPICNVPPIGSNGFLWRKSIVEKVGGYHPKFEEGNFVFRAVKQGFNKVARVPGYGVYHSHVQSFSDFIHKRKRTVKKFMCRKKRNENTWVDSGSKLHIFFSLVYCVSIVFHFFDSIRFFLKNRKIEWFLHSPLCLATVLIYVYEIFVFWIKGLFQREKAA